MSKETILVDMDDVLLDLIPHWVSIINKTFGTSVTEDDITDWNIENCFPTLTKEQVFSIVMLSDTWETIPPTKDGQWFIQKLLDDGYKVKIVTASYYQTITPKIHRFLQLYPMLTWEDITITSDKQSIIGDVIIDDAIHNLIGGTTELKILIDKPHNQNATLLTDDVMHRAYSLNDVYCLIEFFSKE